MHDANAPDAPGGAHAPYVGSRTTMSEFTARALILGLLMCVILGAANAYLGLKAGMTIAATYPAAVIGMAVLRLFRGSILEENFARTVGSIGESIAAGAIFTMPAFAILGLWAFTPGEDYFKSTALMAVGGILGILFVTVLRRVMVNDPELPFPESVAASEIHKAGQKGSEAALTLFSSMGFGALVYLLGELKLFLIHNDFILKVGEVGKSIIRLGYREDAYKVAAGGTTVVSVPAVSPAYLGVGYIIGPELAALNFSGGLLAWGLFVPLLVYLLGPDNIAAFSGWYDKTCDTGIESSLWPQDLADLLGAATAESAPYDWTGLAMQVWKFVVRPIAVGGMLVGACYTLYRMRANLIEGVRRGVRDVRRAAGSREVVDRVDRDLDFRVVGLGILATLVLMVALYLWFTGVLGGALVAAIVMLIAGFFFAAVSGNLVGLIGSSNNPVSGLTLATLVVAALTMLVIGVTGDPGVAAVLGVATVVCVSSAVAGEMLQDLKVGHILGGTPWKMQVGDIIGVVVASAVMFLPLYVLHAAYTFGSRDLPAPQAGLMATLAKGIVGGEMAWPLVVVGILMGIGLILVKVRSPMLVAVGMYLPLETTAAIFVGGLVRGVVDRIARRRGYNQAQCTRVENAGVLCASGLIAGEALMGLVIASVVFFRGSFWSLPESFQAGGIGSVVFFAILIAYFIIRPLRKAGRPDEAAPPTVSM